MRRDTPIVAAVRASLRSIAVGIVVLLGTGFTSGQPASAAGVSASHLLATALSSAQKEGSVRFIDKTTVGTSVQSLQGAISAPEASEVISGAAQPLEVELISDTVFVQGSTAALQSALQITAAQAGPVAGKWIAVSPSDAPFQLLTGDLTIASTLDEFTPSKNLRLGKETTVGKNKVIPIVGLPANLAKGESGSVALLVSPKGAHLPIGGTLITAQGAQRFKEVVAFSNWGARVRLTPPAGAVAFASVLS